MESCLLDLSGDSLNDPALFKQQYVVARKVHHCCECGQAIKPGKRYQGTAGVWGNEFCTFETCVICSNIRSTLLKGCILGELFSSLREFLRDSDIPEDCMVDLKPAALARVCDLIESTW